MSRDTSKYGGLYWCVKVSEHICDVGEIYLHAASVRMENGALIFEGHSAKDDSDKFILLAFAPGHWHAFYAASVLDGAPITVVHWHGEVLPE